MKRILGLFLSLVIVLGMVSGIPVTVGAADAEDFYLYYDGGDEDYTLVEYLGNSDGEVVIPATYNGYPVTRIGEYAFSNSDITSVVIPDTVKSIDEGAFNQCDNLTSVTIPDNVVYMGEEVFYDCDNLRSAVIGNNVNGIHENTFYSCDKLETVVLGNNISSIGRYAFFCCKALSGITIPASVTRIQDYAFNQCLNLANVTFNNGLEYIGYMAFHRCEALTSLVFPYSVEEIDTECFYNCKNITSVTVYNESTNIYENAFGYWENDEGRVVSSDILTVYGKKGSTAERFAKNSNIAFVEENHTHTPSDWIIEKEANCKREGSRIKVCSICGFTCETETIEKTEHNYSTDWVIDWRATEDEDGRKSHLCSGCGDRKDLTVIPALGKNFTDVFHSEMFKLWWSVAFNGEDNIYEFSPKHIKWYTTDKLNIYDYDSYEIEKDYGSGSYTIRYFAIPAEVYEAEALKHFNISDINVLRNDTDHEPVYHTETNTYDMPDAGGFGDSITYATKGYKNLGNGLYEIYGYTLEMAYEKPAGAVEGVDYVMNDGYAGEILKCLKITVEFDGTDVKFISWETISTTDVPDIKELIHNHVSSSWITDKKATVNSAGKKHKECKLCGKTIKTAEIPQLKAAKPKLKSISNTEYGVLTKWSKVTGADKYRVYRKTSKSDWKYIGTTSKTYYTDKTAKSGTKYYYAVKSQNEAGNSSLSSSLSKYYLADPTLKTPSSTKSGVKLTWSKVTGSEGYMVYRKTGTGSYSRIATVKGLTKVTYTDKSAKKGKKYTYKIKAYKSKTYSAYSNAKAITDKY